MIKNVLTMSVVLILIGAGIAPAQLMIDFGSSTSPVQDGYQAYVANHEVANTFTPQSFSAFETTVTITPTWAPDAVNTIMQMLDRGEENFDDATEDLMRDWIGSDTRSAGDPLTLTISGLPAGTYGWLSYHSDTEADTTIGMFDVTVNDALGSSTTTDIQITNTEATTLEDAMKFTTTIVSNGSDVSLVFDTHPYSNQYNEAWFLMNGFELTKETDSAQASSPSPVGDDVPFKSELTWVAGEGATSHNVYLSMSFDDVNDGTALVSPSQTTTSYNPGELEFGQTYYWRVDEINADGVVTGAIWSFTIEPRVIMMPADKIRVTASSYGGDPNVTVDGTGLNSDGQHSFETSAMWLSGGEADAWLQYRFDTAKKLDVMRVWNHNSQLEGNFGFGAKQVTVSHSLDGENWTVLVGVSQFEKATGRADYEANTFVDFAGAVAQHVRIVMNNNWGGAAPQTGLSEVQFMEIPEAARNPQPETGAVDVELAPVLRWRAGRSAVEHVVYFSTDFQAVVDGSAPSETVSVNQYAIPELILGQSYYWRVDEVNDTTVWIGDVWDFNTIDLLLIDDFESYTEDLGSRVYQSWIDGYGWKDDEGNGVEGNGTGSAVGYLNPPTMEKTNKYSGSQSMPLLYDNRDTALISEATYTFESVQDWTTNGINALHVMYNGLGSIGSVTSNNGQVTITAGGGDIYAANDTCKFAYAPLNGDGSIIARVDSFQAEDDWAKAGVMIRDTLESDAGMAFIGITNTKGVTAMRRSYQGDETSADDSTGKHAPYWLKLERSGNVFTASLSVNGSTWETLGNPQTVGVTGEVYIGLAVSSHRDRTEALVEAIFSNIVVTPSVALDQVADVQPETINQPEVLYVVLTDVGNTQAKVVLDEAGTVPGVWSTGVVDLTTQVGQINLALMKSLTIGIGDGTPGSNGIIYIDDIGLARQ